jgi:valyl-tRNA synthetase
LWLIPSMIERFKPIWKEKIGVPILVGRGPTIAMNYVDIEFGAGCPKATLQQWRRNER